MYSDTAKSNATVCPLIDASLRFVKHISTSINCHARLNEMVNAGIPTNMNDLAPKKPTNSMGTNLFAMMVILALAGLAAVYLMDFLELNRNKQTMSQETTIEFTIAATNLAAPQSWLNSEVDGDSKAYSVVDILLPVEVDSTIISVSATLLASSKAAPSSFLLDTLYIHKFKDVPSQQAFGLVAKQMVDEAGYSGETVWYDAVSANPFVAKCLKEKLPKNTAKNCVTTVLVNKRVSALVRFEETLLPHWRAFQLSLRAKLATLNAS